MWPMISFMISVMPPKMAWERDPSAIKNWPPTKTTPVMARRRVTVVRMDMRRCAGTKAATTMRSGKNEMNALRARGDAAVDELRLEHPVPFFHSSVCSAQPRMTWARPRTFANACRLVLPVPASAMIPSLGSDRSHALAGYSRYPSRASHPDWCGAWRCRARFTVRYPNRRHR